MKITYLKSFFVVFFLLFANLYGAEGNIIFVDAEASGANNGSNWNDAYSNLQDALAVAQSGDEILVAQGIYKPYQGAGATNIVRESIFQPIKSDSTSEIFEDLAFQSLQFPIPPPPPPASKTATFQLKNGVTVKGGYAGHNESDPNARDIDKYETILSGDLNGDDVEANNPFDLLYEPNRIENSNHVVTASGTDGTTILDGFTITGGNANWGSLTSPYVGGGGMYIVSGNPIVVDCIFMRNTSQHFGGGIYVKDGSPQIVRCLIFNNAVVNIPGSTMGRGGGMSLGGAPIIDNCVIENNFANAYGGGIYCFSSDAMISHCEIVRNTAWFGGGLLSFHGRPTVANCLLSRNKASDSGGGIATGHCSATIINCTILNNIAESRGGAIHLNWGDSEIKNSILWANTAPMGPEIYILGGGNPVVACCDVNEGWVGEGNIDTDPCFIDAGYWDANGIWIEGDYHFLQNSACIDTGDPCYPVDPNETDLDGNPRVIGGRIDMGAYEFQNTPPVADAGPNQVVECACNTVQGTKVMLDGTGSYDIDGDPLTYTWSGPFIESPVNGATPTVTLEDGCPGEYVVTLVVDDNIEDSEPSEVLVTVVDTTPPELTFSVTPAMLWPPNNKMVNITPAWTVSDKCYAMPVVSLVSISINEYDTKVNGQIDEDVKIGDDGSIYLRAERSGTGDDRIYTIIYQAIDDCGNTTVRSTTVTVPHDQR